MPSRPRPGKAEQEEVTWKGRNHGGQLGVYITSMSWFQESPTMAWFPYQTTLWIFFPTPRSSSSQSLNERERGKKNQVSLYRV